MNFSNVGPAENFKRVIAVGILAFIVYAVATKQEDAKEQTKSYSAPVRETVQLTADQLYDAYDRNEVAADIAFKGKTIEVSGYVTSINKSVFDSMYVDLGVNKRYERVSMRAVRSEQEKIAALQKGQFTVFRCEGVSRTMRTPFGNECVLAGVR